MATYLFRLAEGFTRSHAAVPAMHRAVAVKNDAGHPKCAAITGVSEAVTRAANLGAHVHRAGNRSRGIAGEIGRYRTRTSLI
jgi:hypothetical protein